MKAFIQFCGDIEGCRIELGAAGLHDTTALRKYPLMGPSCRFFYNAKSGEWSVGPYCYYPYIVSLYSSKNKITDFSEIAPYRPYASSRTGIVSDNRVSTALAFTKACYLTDVAPDENNLSGNAHYKLTDVGKSWFLHTTTQAWAAKAISQERCGPDESKCKYKQVRWVGDKKYCVLIIED